MKESGFEGEIFLKRQNSYPTNRKTLQILNSTPTKSGGDTISGDEDYVLKCA
jgi:hypothetical protein